MVFVVVRFGVVRQHRWWNTERRVSSPGVRREGWLAARGLGLGLALGSGLELRFVLGPMAEIVGMILVVVELAGVK